MAFGEEARLLMMRILQNFVRDNRGRWDGSAWEQLVERVRRLGFETIAEERMKQLAEDNRERWLAGENGVGPPPVAAAAPAAESVPAPAPAAAMGEAPPALAEETQSIDVAGVVEELEAPPAPVAEEVQTTLIDDSAADEALPVPPPVPAPVAPPASKPVVKKTMKKSAKKAPKKALKKKAAKKKAKKAPKKKAAKKKAKKPAKKAAKKAKKAKKKAK
jgi:hypothetical protein